jgi:hypothetical protein
MRSYERVNQSEIQKRINALMFLCFQGHSSSVIVKTACHNWEITERQAKRYLQKAREQQKKLGSQPIEDTYNLVFHKVDYLYQLGIQTKDHDLSRKASADLIKLYKEKRKDVMNDTTQSHHSRLIKADQLEAVIRSLEHERGNLPE